MKYMTVPYINAIVTSLITQSIILLVRFMSPDSRCVYSILLINAVIVPRMTDIDAMNNDIEPFTYNVDAVNTIAEADARPPKKDAMTIPISVNVDCITSTMNETVTKINANLIACL